MARVNVDGQFGLLRNFARHWWYSWQADIFRCSIHAPLGPLDRYAEVARLERYVNLSTL